jgi:hypothetical protein
MLDQPALLIRPWQGNPPRAWIVEPGTAALLGSVRWFQPSGPSRWLAPWRQPGLAVHECDDEPLLLTARQTLLPWRSWQVRDADEHPVGRVHGLRLLDVFGQPLASLHEEGGSSVYRDREQILAVTRHEEDGVRLTFQPDERGNPFVRMVLLAATLLHNVAAQSVGETGIRTASGSSRSM